MEIIDMDYYVSPEFQKRITQLIYEKNIDLAIQEINKAIKEADSLRKEEDVCYLYSQLAGIYFNQNKSSLALSVLDECEHKYPQSVIAKFNYLEKLFWYARDYEKALQKAEAIKEYVEMELNYYHKAIYLKGLCHANMNQFKQAVEILRTTEYYDLALVEILINHNIELSECRNYLLRALAKYQLIQNKGNNMLSMIQKVNSLINKLDEINGL